MAQRRRGFSKNLKNIDTKAITADKIIGNIEAISVSTTDLTVNSVAVNNLDLSGSTESIDFANRPLTNVQITSGSINGVTLSNSIATDLQSLSVAGSSILQTTTLEGTNGQSAQWTNNTNTLSLSSGATLQAGDVVVSGTTISPRLLGGTIAFTGNVDFTNSNVFGVGTIASPFIVDDVSLSTNILETIASDLVLQSASGVIDLRGSIQINGGNINSTPIGNSIPSSGAFTSLSANVVSAQAATLENALSFTVASAINVPTSTPTALTFTDGTSDFITLNSASNTVTIGGDLNVTGNLSSATSSVTSIVTPGLVTIQSTTDRVDIISNGPESIPSLADSIFINTTNASGGIKIQSQGNGGIQCVSSAGNIALQPSAPFDVTVARDILCGGGIEIAAFLGAGPNDGALQYSGSLQVRTGGVFESLATETYVDDRVTVNAISNRVSVGDSNTFTGVNQIILGNGETTTASGQMLIDGSVNHIQMSGIGTQSLGSLVTISSTGGIRKTVSLPVYASNAAAILGGLGAGDLYRLATGQIAIVF